MKLFSFLGSEPSNVSGSFALARFEKSELKYHAFGVLLLASGERLSFRVCSRGTEHEEYSEKKVSED